jgi:hypothetical protein
VNEKIVEKNLILYCSKKGSIVFKNNVGMAFKEVNGVKYPIKFGLCEGSSDLIGWTPITITPDMVGKKLAVFTAIEVKLNKNGKYRATEKQKNFINAVKKSGGYACIADCEKDVDLMLDNII